MEVSQKIREMMEIGCNGNDDGESEPISEAFTCCICLDLLYKPVVLACGHMSCFWCVHKSMCGLHSSRCPICRNTYYHFPYICQMLHFLLLKMYPCAYNRRQNKILEEEKDMCRFSPEINGHAYQLQPDETRIKPHDASLLCLSEADPSLNLYSVRDGEILERLEHAQSGQLLHQESVFANLNDSSNDTAATRDSSMTCKQVSVDDVLCGSCKSMLFQPVVLNCGHAFCVCCISTQADEMLKCELCQSVHPGDIPKVCLEFDHFLEEQFPKEYNLRRSTLQRRQEQFQSVAPGSSAAGMKSSHVPFSSREDPIPWWNGNSELHIGVGCDSCGMYPIIGDRYRCKDCVEEVGYDLCKDCYTTSSKLPGRFNQQHTSDHEFEIVKSTAMHNLMLRLLRGHLQEVSAISDAGNTNEDEEGSDSHRPNQSFA